jgi:2-keto-4-pentenoate hydratase/2-oxohepta-3-ene-1,7-dioic acid hydratase in catechol pathway
MFRPRGSDLVRGWPGRIEDGHVVQLAAQTLQAYFTGGGNAREHAVFRLADVELLAPVLEPPSLRLFDLAGRAPALRYGNPTTIFGPSQEVPYPEGVKQLDYELVLAAVAGAGGAIAGFTIMNDWTARDLERGRRGWTGAAKARDFATSIGPVLVPAGELGDGWGAPWRVSVSGEERAAAGSVPMRWSWQELVAAATLNASLLPGDLIGLGWPGALARSAGQQSLRPGDEVELEIEGIGVLESTVAARGG